MNVHLRVLDSSKKSKFSHYNITNVPKFSKPEDLKKYLLKNHSAILAPAQTKEFPMGYFVEERGNQKFNIASEEALQQAYLGMKNDKLSLWADPHVTEPGKTTLKRPSKSLFRKIRISLVCCMSDCVFIILLLGTGSCSNTDPSHCERKDDIVFPQRETWREVARIQTQVMGDNDCKCLILQPCRIDRKRGVCSHVHLCTFHSIWELIASLMYHPMSRSSGKNLWQRRRKRPQIMLLQRRPQVS